MEERDYFIHIAVVSFVFLLIEVLITRLFSSLFQYQFAFLVLTIAMSGIFLSGLYYSRCKEKGEQYARFLLLLPALLLVIILFFSFAAHLKMPLDTTSRYLWLVIFPVIILITGSAFFIVSFSILFLLGTYPKRTNELYFTNLFFSMLGCVAALAVLTYSFPSAGLFLCVAALFLLYLKDSWKAATTNPRVLAVPALILTLSFASALFWNSGNGVVFEKWTTYSKVAVWPTTGPVCLGCANQTNIELYAGYIDSNAYTPIFKHVENGSLVKNDVTHIGYYLLQPNATVVIIGSGGGRDVLGARNFMPKKIIAIEINPTIIEAANLFSSSTYNQSDTQVIVDDGRIGLRQLGVRPDLIQLSLVDTWAAASSGSYALVENYLYTREAFDIYLDRLSPSGIISITRWSSEKEKLSALAYAALASSGITVPADHMALTLSPNSTGQKLVTLIVKKQPFTSEERQQLATVSEALDFSIEPVQAPVGQQHVVSDDSPFFFFNASGLLILLVVLLAILLVGLAVFVPELKKKSLNFEELAFFSLIGAGFMFVEFLLLQKNALVLQNPTLNFSLTLAVLLVFSGLGSLFASKTRKLALAATALPLLIIAYILLMDGYSAQLALLDTSTRIAAVLILTAPLAFLMGVFFPSYFETIKKEGSPAVGLSWAANGFLSVLAPTISLMLSVYVGFDALAAVSFVVYCLAMFLLIRRLNASE
jgi:spermidine synthase